MVAIDEDGTVCQSIRKEYYQLQDDPFFVDMVFANGGDRNDKTTPEKEFCYQNNIKTIWGMLKLILKAKASKQADREPAAESSHDHEPRAGPTPGLVSFEFDDVYTLYYYSVYRTYGLQYECKG